MLSAGVVLVRRACIASRSVGPVLAMRTTTLHSVHKNKRVFIRCFSAPSKTEIEADLTKASERLQAQDFDEAFDLFASALAKSQNSGDKQNEIMSLQGISVASMGQGDYQKSVSYYNILIEKTSDDVAANSQAYLALSALHVQSAMVDQALITLNKGLEKTKDAKRTAQIKKVQRELAWAFIDTAGQFNKYTEIKHFMSNIKYITKKEKDPNFEIDAYMRSAKLVAGKSTANAKEFIDEIVGLVKENPFAGLHREHWQGLMLMATIYQRAKDTKNAEDYYKQALELAKSSNDSERILNSMQGLGTVYLPDRVREAFPLYEDIIKFCQERGNINGELEATLNLAIYYTQANEMTNAEKLFLKAEALAKHHNLVDLEVLASAHLAVHHLNKRTTTVKLEIKDVIERARPLQSKAPLKLALSALSTVEIEEKNWKEAIVLLKELMPLQNGDFKEQIRTITLLAKAYKETGDEEGANNVFEESLMSGAGLEGLQNALQNMPLPGAPAKK